MCTVNESLGSLKALESPTNYWDHIIIYIIDVNQLAAETYMKHGRYIKDQGASFEHQHS